MGLKKEQEKVRLLSLALDSGFDEALARVCLEELSDLYGSDGQDFVTVECCGDDYLARLADCSHVDEDWDACEGAGLASSDADPAEEGDCRSECGDAVQGVRGPDVTELGDSDSGDDDDVMIIDNPNLLSRNAPAAASVARGAHSRRGESTESRQAGIRSYFVPTGPQTGLLQGDNLKELQGLDDFSLANLAVFGHKSFRQLQRKACESTMAGLDCFILMPTGGGKSLCYQLPAILCPGVTVVVSPLLSLIQDQVLELVERYAIPAAFLSSQQTSSQAMSVLNELRKERPSCKLVYVTPEKIVGSTSFQDILKRLDQKGQLARFVIDEAHCVSQWGHDFRQDYKALGILKQQFHRVPIMALTATATHNVRKDILKILRIPRALVLEVGFDRPNLTYEVLKKDAKDPLKQLGDLIKSRFDKKCGIVYCLSQKECVEVSSHLQQTSKLKSAYYHAGVPSHQREWVQQSWQRGEVQVICATIAFGMGINKADVRYVIHNTMSKAIEGYYQESGRAGRDGLPATCLLLYQKKDFSRIICMLRSGRGRSKERFKIGMEQARKMQAYCEEKMRCRREMLLEYFGEAYERASCRTGGSACDLCRST